MTWKVSEVRRRFPAFANGGLGIYLDNAVFSPVHGHKHRHDCVLLPFEALEACLDGLAGND